MQLKLFFSMTCSLAFRNEDSVDKTFDKKILNSGKLQRLLFQNCSSTMITVHNHKSTVQNTMWFNGKPCFLPSGIKVFQPNFCEH